MSPGIYHDLSFEAYREIDAVNQSTLKAFARNPWAWKQGLPALSGDSFEWGRMFEQRLFYPDNSRQVPNGVTVLTDAIKAQLVEETKAANPKASGRFSKNLKSYREWAAAQPGEIIDSEEWNRDWNCVGVASDRCRNEPNVKSLLALGGKHEVTIVWRDPDTALLCKGLIDWVPNTIGSLVDVKTSKELNDASSAEASWRFARAVRHLGYAMQAAYYLDGWNLALEQSGAKPDPRNAWLFVVSGNKSPWPAAAYRLSQETIDQGASKYRHALRLWKQCHESNTWPGLTDQEHWPELPTLKEN